MRQILPAENRWARVLVVLLFAHVAWGVSRIPTKVYDKRLGQIDHHRDVGAVRFHLDNEHIKGAAAVEFVLAHTPPDCVVLLRGEWRGAAEFVPPLIAPRLAVWEVHCPEGQSEMFGRPLARGRLPSGEAGILVLVGLGNDLELAIR